MLRVRVYTDYDGACHHGMLGINPAFGNVSKPFRACPLHAAAARGL